MNLAKAIHIAARAFEMQIDKGGEPYIMHCIRVMNNLNTEDEELKIIAILHDIIEDCNYTNGQLHGLGFSNRVLNGIDALTKKHGQSYEKYLDIVSSNQDAIRVKLADLQDNMNLLRLSKIDGKDLERQQKYFYAYNRLKVCLE